MPGESRQHRLRHLARIFALPPDILRIAGVLGVGQQGDIIANSLAGCIVHNLAEQRIIAEFGASAAQIDAPEYAKG